MDKLLKSIGGFEPFPPKVKSSESMVQFLLFVLVAIDEGEEFHWTVMCGLDRAESLKRASFGQPYLDRPTPAYLYEVNSHILGYHSYGHTSNDMI